MCCRPLPLGRIVYSTERSIRVPHNYDNEAESLGDLHITLVSSLRSHSENIWIIHFSCRKGDVGHRDKVDRFIPIGFIPTGHQETNVSPLHRLSIS